MKTLAAALALLSVSAAAAAPPAAPAGPDYRLAIPFEEYKLPNGLRVVLSRDNALPVVAMCVIYNVGFRSEDKGHTGYAHLFEHLMRESAADTGKSDLEKYILANGGRIDGAAHPAYSMYSLVAPSNLLGPALSMQAGRMSGLAITRESLKVRQDAIREEQLGTVFGYNSAILEIWPGLVFGNPQNAHSFLGPVRDGKPPAAGSTQTDDVSAATVEEVTKFYRTWFAPNNAVLVLAGDFQTADTKKIIEQYFGGIQTQPPPQLPDLTEPLRVQGKAVAFQDWHVGVPAVIVGWPAPERHSPAWYAVQLLDAILTTGQTARLQSNLVQGRKSLLQVQSGIGFPFEVPASSSDPAEYSILALYRPGLRPQLIANELQQEIDSIAIRGVDPQELARIKAVLRVKRVSQLQGSLERANLLGQYALLDGKLAAIDEDFVNLMAVKPADVQVVARRLLTAARRDVLLIEPGPKPPAPKADSTTGK